MAKLSHKKASNSWNVNTKADKAIANNAGSQAIRHNKAPFVLCHFDSGAIPINIINNNAIGLNTALKYGAPTEIFPRLKASKISGYSVPNRTVSVKIVSNMLLIKSHDGADRGLIHAIPHLLKQVHWIDETTFDRWLTDHPPIIRNVSGRKVGEVYVEIPEPLELDDPLTSVPGMGLVR